MREGRRGGWARGAMESLRGWARERSKCHCSPHMQAVVHVTGKTPPLAILPQPNLNLQTARSNGVER